MALVNYDYGSGSDEDDDPHSSLDDKSVSLAKKVQEEELAGDVPELLSHLPKSKTATANVVDDKLEDFVPKYQPTVAKEKKTQKVKITIPSLSQFQDEEDEPQPKQRKTQIKGSTLLSMLPPVKGTLLTTRSFIPNVVSARPKAKALVPKKTVETKKEKAVTSGSDAEDDDIDVPETFDDETWQKVCGRPAKRKQIEEVSEEVEVKVLDIAPEPVKPYDGLDNAAFKELVGASKRPVNVKLVDINEEEILPDRNVWMTKSLTDPDSAPQPEVEDPVDPTRKKKHHITYLAEKAKASEQELQSQWSSSKFTRNQTRAKYGF